MNGSMVASIVSVGLGQLEGKLRWEGCQGVSTAAVLRQT